MSLQADSEPEIDALRHEIDRMDTEIIELIEQRTAISRKIGRIRRESGGPRIVEERERQVRKRYAQLGQPGERIVDALFELGRGKSDTSQA